MSYGENEIKAILEDPFEGGREWTVHGLGMLRTYLDDERTERLHVWSNRLAIRNVSAIHSHPWGLESTVVSGGIGNIRFIKVNVTDPHGPPEYFEGQIDCTDGGGLVAGSAAHLVRLQEQESEFYEPGDIYSQDPDEIHTTRASDGAVTLMTKVPADRDPMARVYWRHRYGPNGWVDAAQRPATEAEVIQTCGLALARWSTGRVKPSDIVLSGSVPLTATFGRAEAEQAAALLVNTMAALDDSWRTVSMEEVSAHVRRLVAEDSVPPWMSNIVFRPSFTDLERRGGCRMDGSGPGAKVELTTSGLVILRTSKWCRPPASEGL